MKQDQKSFILRTLSNRAGQAVVEYVLLCVIIVGLIMGAAKMFKTFDEGINNYIGGYISCLMEYGELPSLGVRNPELKKHVAGTGKKCDAKFDAFSFDSGRPPSGGGGGSSMGGGGVGGNRNGSNRPGGGSGGDGDGGGTGRGRNGEDGSGNDAASAIARGGGGGSGSNKRELRSDEGYAKYSTADNPYNFEESKVRVIEEESEEEDSKSSRGRRGIRRMGGTYGRADQYRAISGRMKQEIEKQKRKPAARTPTKTVKKISDDAKTRVTIKKDIDRTISSKELKQSSNTDGFTFGNIFRYLLIAAMVLAIIIFFGGQILNYSNSKD